MGILSLQKSVGWPWGYICFSINLITSCAHPTFSTSDSEPKVGMELDRPSKVGKGYVIGGVIAVETEETEEEEGSEVWIYG